MSEFIHKDHPEDIFTISNSAKSLKVEAFQILEEFGKINNFEKYLFSDPTPADDLKRSL
jgi:hypothetical protein